MEEITLRPLNSSDVIAFMEWAGDPEVTHSLFWDHYSSNESAEIFLIDVVEKHPWFMAICIDEIPIGAITLDKGKSQASVRAELGYVISKHAWGKGIGTKAVAIAIARGFKEINVKRIEAYVDPDNVGSIRILEKNGFNRDGLLKNYLIHRGSVRDRFLFSITI